MKKSNFLNAFKLSSLVLMTLVLTVTSCKKDKDDPTPPVIVLDGTYIKGAGTALTDFDAKGMMKATKNEVNQADRAQLLELYVAVKAGSDGFNIVKVEGDVKTTYGPGADFAVVGEADRITDEPKLDFQRGSYVETTTPFTVPADGLYHVVIDTEVGKVVVVPVQYWGLIGAATPGGWGGDTQIPAAGFDLSTMTFEVADVTMTKADFKFRYSGGWKVIIDDTFDLGGGVVGIRVNTNFGGAVNALVPGGANIANETSGKYTAKMVWTLGTGFVATMTKTGDLDLTDYSATQLGLVGDGLMVDGVQHNWDVTVQVQVPVVTNETTYEWSFTGVEVTTLGSFKIREGQDWNGKSFGYPQVTMAGLSADKFDTNGDGNFVPLEDGTYDIIFKIDAVTETYTFTVNPAGAAPEMFMLGDGCAAGWDNTAALPMMGSNGVYYLATNLLGTGKYIKFITTLGQWAPMYGTDAAGTSTGGNLVFRATESDPDPSSIPAPEAEGMYVVTINTNDMTYTIAPALYMLGDGCTAGWDNNAALPLMGGANGVYSITTTLLGTPKAVKFITTLGQWAPMYGTDAAGTSTGGALVFRATEADPDPANIPAPDAQGMYTITADITGLTYTIAPAK
ncbi:MAG: SusF/SusE family outer membrane protein [Bacteroidetes bacterium]|nr:SusF/SusE family outer membrane protein [Bacteroidales bacterium]MBU1010467.1 SusF/SusE family outer membrane protein [Bacteroidota bacterium]